MPDDVAGFFGIFFDALKYQLPFVVAYIIGIVLALVYWRRCFLPCLLTLLACLIKLSASLSFPLTAALLVRRNPDLFNIVALVICVIDAAGYALLLVAVFKGRSVAVPSFFGGGELGQRAWHEAPPSGTAPSDDTGFREGKP